MMDDGAHFYRSDFQVHTPRDLNWKGAGAASEAERKQWAQELVAACREKGLQAIAITDHHDVALFKYVREAAAQETDGDGKALLPHRRLVVFPGIELTLAVPCQALLILDADFPAELLPQVLLALNVKPSAAPDAESKHSPTIPIEHIRSLETLYTDLEKAEILKGRFIVLPHVGESRTHSILRKGFATDYKKMPCVGGFVDGSVSQHGTGNKGILAGKNKEWGNKPLAVFQTSDSRSRDFSELGTHGTWVKWARPTAEALRQACLARHSRIALTEPHLPDTWITRVEVSNSKFLGPLTLDLNPQYNALIGGRGTGKSTVLEYIRWALCDQPSKGSNLEEMAEFQRRRSSLVANTLIPLGAAVDVSFVLNHVAHVVRRKATGETSIRIADKPFEACTEDNVRELLPVRAFSQKQLSTVGTRLDELRRFVYAPIQAGLSATEERIAGLRSALRAAFALVERQRTIEDELAAARLERESVAERITQLRESLKGLSDADQAVINRQADYEAEQRVMQAIERDLQAAREAFDDLVSGLDKLPSKASTRRSGTPNVALLETAQGRLETWLSGAVDSVRALRAELEETTSSGTLEPIFSEIANWKRARESHRTEYESAKARSTAHEHILAQIHTLETRHDALISSLDGKTQLLNGFDNPAARLAALRVQWVDVHKERTESLKAQCDELTALSKSRLRATLNRASDIGPLTERLIQLLRGTKIRADKISDLTTMVSSAADPLNAWTLVLDEFYKLATLTVDEDTTTVLPSTPRLETAGFSTKERLAIARQLEPTAWLELALFDLKDLPVFEYQVRSDDFIPFQQASPGQQATVLLSILLSQNGPPLLIDQPEDDLNMKIINEIVENLWQAKGRRQVVFVSHNANLVVNGDAELVICCDYRTSGTESGGKIKLTGAIDIPGIKTEITDVMEGGEDAFLLRKTKYGF